MPAEGPRGTPAMRLAKAVLPNGLRLRLAFARRARSTIDPGFLRRTYGIGSHWSEGRCRRWYLRKVRPLGLSPNSKFDEDYYLESNPDVKRAIVHGGFLCGYDHYLRNGKAENRAATPRASGVEAMRAFFEADWYRDHYATELAAEGWDGEPFEHYLTHGARAGWAPNSWFDELWYQTAYPDVSEAILEDHLLCGFEHWVSAGRFERREPAYDKKAYLEMKMPGVTRPAGLLNLRGLERKLEPVSVTEDELVNGERRLNVLVPTLDPAIVFGGYTTLIELVNRIPRSVVPVRIVICDDERFSLDWALRQSEGSALHDLLSQREVVSIADGEKLPLHAGDRFLCYSGWLALKSAPLAKHTGFERFAFLVQEYEPIFHSQSSLRMILDTAYDTPHLPIFNSPELADFFRRQKIGVFSDPTVRDHMVFQHALTPVERPTRADLAARTERRLLCYARPESHAERNLFEVMVIALRRAIERGAFTGDWSFHGVGSLTPGHSVKLSSDHTMEITPKLPLGEYGRTLPTYDVGVSLMYAPHPSLLPFEMAGAGMVVVTNTYSNRSADHLRAISPNLEPAPLTVEGITDAIIRAVGRVDDHEGRVAGAAHGLSTSWDQTFDQAFVRTLLEKLDIA